MTTSRTCCSSSAATDKGRQTFAVRRSTSGVKSGPRTVDTPSVVGSCSSWWLQ